MEYQEDLEFKAEILKKIREREFSDRSGVHFSDLNYCLNKQALRHIKGVEDTEHETLLYSLGWATQRWLTGQTEDEPEREADGIKVTCDAIVDVLASEGDGYVEYNIALASTPWELKATFQSSNKPILDNPHWIRQLMAQCYVLGVTRGYLTRLEILGDWGSIFPRGATPEEKKENKAKSKKPELHAYRFDFTQEELEKNWEWLKERRNLYLGILGSGQLLPKALAIPSGQQWECSYCHFVDDCSKGEEKAYDPSSKLDS